VIKNPSELLHAAKDTVNTQAQRKHITITIEVQDNIAPIQADNDKTTWVLVNFLTNAIRHSYEHGNILIRCHQHDNAIRFSVQDLAPV
jgi:signal transduction histidine kinase